MKFLVTGVAGFIGHSVAKKLCSQGHDVVGLDSLSDYYDVQLKRDRLDNLQSCTFNTNGTFRFVKLDLIEHDTVMSLFEKEAFDRVIHLAAQAGVRHSIDQPMIYAEANLSGFLVVLEACRQYQIEHLVYASSSSVYGLNKQVPFTTEASVNHPVSLYAATKKSNELMAHSYSHLYNLPTTGLRLFTVYGPWCRPDMALLKFAHQMMRGEAIALYNEGNLQRDFTYIDDVTEGIVRIQAHVPTVQLLPEIETQHSSLYRVYNIGHGQPIKLADFVETLEKSLGKKALKRFLPMQPGDVYQTWAETEDFFNVTGFTPKVSIKEGVQAFATWYLQYFGYEKATALE